ncbi:phosphatidylinositol glycan, class H [Trypanosoma grayi]|uniref:phosphatidylinositol glycan, class H n=1 Tax=Trypanosoma grayi TaxID=71804 RepID=UPI0004F48E8B|nr:phosphatidylinositol glycan, class H [Trypanosoma grayi]KEG07844.1 phosphatidylinositol glycan, class H [Trypanosoma grayi]
MGDARNTSYPSGGVPQKLLVANHVTSTNAVVDAYQTDYSETVRSYRVCRRDPLGPHTPPFLRFLSPNDMMLLALLVALSVPSLPLLMDRLWMGGWMPFQAIGDINDFDGDVLLVREAAASLSPRLILLLVCFIVSVCRLVVGVRRVHTEEVTAIRGLGMQITSYGAFGGIRAQRFVELRLIRSLIIHDAFFRCQAIFFLSATVENEATRLVLFEETLPRLAVLQRFLCGLRQILYEEPEEGATLGEMEGQGSEGFDDSVDGDYRGGEDESDVTEREFPTFPAAAGDGN